MATDKFIIKRGPSFIELLERGWRGSRYPQGATEFDSEPSAKEALINHIVNGSGSERLEFKPKGEKFIIQQGDRYVSQITFNSIMAVPNISYAIEFKSISEGREALLVFFGPEFVKVNS